MSSSLSFDKLIDRVYVSAECVNEPAVLRARERAVGTPFLTVDTAHDIPREHLSSRTLFVERGRGEAVGRCPGTKGHLCCNYITVDLYTGCSLGCSYCIMKSYLNFAPITVRLDVDRSIERIRDIARLNPAREVRVGSGEVGDSLLFDPVFELSRDFIEGLSDLPNVSFEVKTKTDFVDHLLDIPHKGGAVVGFSMNAEPISRAEDGISSSIADRIRAAHRAVAAGFRVAFHFDPVIAQAGWESRYAYTVDTLAAIPADRIAWISIGTIRYTAALAEKIGDRPYLFDEYVPCRDGKFRYLQRRRIGVYRVLVERLRAAFGPEAPLYLCMESAAVWDAVFGAAPHETACATRLFEHVVAVDDHDRARRD